MGDGFRSGGFAAGRPVLALMVGMALMAAPAIPQQPGLPAPEGPNDGAVEWYRDARGRLLPVPPEFLRDFNRELLISREAAADARPLPDEIRSEVDIVSLEPGGMAPVVHLSPGIATVISFSDATGQPWPVAGFVVGDRDGFDLLHPAGADGVQGPSHLTAAPLRNAGWTNLVVSLAGSPTPVVLTLLVDRIRPHYRLDIQVLALGPNARASPETQSTPPSPGSRELLRFLAAAGLPEDAVEAGIGNDVGGTRVWVSRPGSDEQAMWVRTRHALLGPEWQESLTGPQGVRIYKLRRPASMLLFAVGGRTVMARVDLP